MDLVAEQLADNLAALPSTESVLVRPRLKTVRPGQAPSALARALGRFAQLPMELTTTARPEADFYHVADHSYAHLALLFPRAQTGVYCHDIDAFRSLLPGYRTTSSRALLSRLLLAGLQHARVVFHNTMTTRRELLEHGFVQESRLVHAPLGIASEFLEVARSEPNTSNYLLHVGSCIPRKNVDFLLELFAALRQRTPGLELVQVGGTFSAQQARIVAEHGLAGNITQRRGLTRAELARLYAGARAVVVPSLGEGFGLPVIEALACGAPVIASDIPALREVGFEGVRFCAVNDAPTWLSTLEAMLASGERPSEATRARIRGRYSWHAHGTIVARAYAAG